MNVLVRALPITHGSLPSEIRFAIEDSISSGTLDCLVATTTMTEGVNLPVRSVVIASQGTYTDQGYTEFIIGSKLINAIGRAGRATKETEGVVVLARQAKYENADFDRLSPTDDATAAISWLATDEALRALAEFEDQQRAGVDAVIEMAMGVAAEFVSFIWFLAATLDGNSTLPTVNEIERTLSRSLAWIQLDDHQRVRWLDVAANTLITYLASDPIMRKRWSRSGASIRSSQQIGKIAQELADLLRDGVPAQTSDLIEIILDNGRLERLLSLPEAPKKSVFDQRSGRRTPIQVPMRRILLDWVGGQELRTIADSYFAAVPDIEFRFEQLGDFLNDYFQVFFPWAVGAVVRWVNESLGEFETEAQIPTSLPAYIRWGISDPTALYLMSHGIRSRRMANAIARLFTGARPSDVRAWLQTFALAEWRDLFAANVSELRNLFDFASERGRSMGATLLAFDTVEIHFPAVLETLTHQPAELVPLAVGELAPIQVRCYGIDVGIIPLRYLAEISSWIEAGLELNTTVNVSDRVATLSIQLVPSTD